MNALDIRDLQTAQRPAALACSAGRPVSGSQLPAESADLFLSLLGGILEEQVSNEDEKALSASVSSTAGWSTQPALNSATAPGEKAGTRMDTRTAAALKQAFRDMARSAIETGAPFIEQAASRKTSTSVPDAGALSMRTAWRPGAAGVSLTNPVRPGPSSRLRFREEPSRPETPWSRQLQSGPLRSDMTCAGAPAEAGFSPSGMAAPPGGKKLSSRQLSISPVLFSLASFAQEAGVSLVDAQPVTTRTFAPSESHAAEQSPSTAISTVTGTPPSADLAFLVRLTAEDRQAPVGMEQDPGKASNPTKVPISATGTEEAADHRDVLPALGPGPTLEPEHHSTARTAGTAHKDAAPSTAAGENDSDSGSGARFAARLPSADDPPAPDEKSAYGEESPSLPNIEGSSEGWSRPGLSPEPDTRQYEEKPNIVAATSENGRSISTAVPKVGPEPAIDNPGIQLGKREAAAKHPASLQTDSPTRAGIASLDEAASRTVPANIGRTVKMPAGRSTAPDRSGTPAGITALSSDLSQRAENSMEPGLADGPAPLRAFPSSRSETELDTGVPQQPIRQISLKVASPDSANVDVQVTQKAGRLQVAVRTPDPQLTQSLRAGIGDLMGKLQERGFKTEAWIPGATHSGSLVALPQAGGQRGTGNQDSGARDQPHSGQGNPGDANRRQRGRWTAQLEQMLPEESGANHA